MGQAAGSAGDGEWPGSRFSCDPGCNLDILGSVTEYRKGQGDWDRSKLDQMGISKGFEKKDSVANDLAI